MKFGKYDVGEDTGVHAKRSGGGVQYRLDFPNGYGASIIRTSFNYGGESGLWEVAVMNKGELDYNTPITSDVVGWCDDEAVIRTLEAIEAVDVAHGVNRKIAREAANSLKENN